LFVNRQAITVQDVLEPLWQDLQRKAESLPPASYHAYLRQQVSRQVEFQIGLAVVYEKAQAAYAEDRYQEAFDKQADRMVQDVIDRRFGGVEVRYQAHLEKLGLSLQDVTKRAKRQVMVTQFLRDRFQPHVHEPTRRELMQYYRTHRDEFTTPAKAELFLLEIPLETLLGKPLQEATAEQVRKARAKARSELRQALQALNQGAEFAEVARTYSHGVRAKTGGYWGEISPGALANRWKSVNEVLFSLKSGQISEIVETDASCFVVKCGRRTPEKTLSFEQAQEQILQDLAEQEFNRRRDAYVRELVEQAAIRPRNQFVLAVMAAAPEPVPRVGHTTRKPR
jgi:parvulin-like peptidyl-prolyl isomerase